ncbi:MAG: N-acetylmuramoyl-L-alanine amidase [Porticoccaceae bacterium]|nr:N-acetylmuramoyl-L-alanine amidase [Porticoccaceae bacterium]
MEFDWRLKLGLKPKRRCCWGLRWSFFWVLATVMTTLGPLYSAVSVAANVESVRLWRAPDKTRLVFDLSSAVDHQLITLVKPDRLVIDIADVALKTSLDSLDLSTTSIAKIRHAVRNKTGLRVVLDLRSKISPKSFSLSANEQYGNRLVIDLYDKKSSVSRSVEEVIEQKNRKIIIAIDAGHGGEDPGALGPRRVREKVVALQIAQKLEALFDSNPYFQGELIRTGDYYISLPKRTKIAHDKRADFFISIHADAFTNPKAYGASVYALSTKGATSEAATILAAKENRADLIGGASSLSLNDYPDDVLKGVLLDLSQTATVSSSLDAGKYVLKNMGGVARLHKKKVEQAGFMVLKSPDVPSLLIETGFISNPKEARDLSTRSYQRKMANAIYQGLVQYYADSPPVGTLLAKNDGNIEQSYVIARGDTLSEIAARYNTSVRKIVRHNKMKSSSIRVGQKILIPSS